MSNEKNCAAIRVCKIADIECSRNCGTGDCKREREARYPVDQHEAAPAQRVSLYDDLTHAKAVMEGRAPLVLRAPLEGTGNGAREREILQVIDERDRFEEVGTRLANAVGEFLGVDVGEWSSANDPILVAIEALESHAPRAEVAGEAPAGIEPPRHIIDTAMDVARDQYGHGVTRASIVAIWKALGKPWIAAHEVAPINMLLFCPRCGEQHIDAPETFTPVGRCECAGPDECEACASNRAAFEESWQNPPHRSHLCHTCGTIWRPADVPTNGVASIETRGKADTWTSADAAAAPADEPSELEQVVACLGDDAATLRDADEYIEMADNMEAAARLLESCSAILAEDRAADEMCNRWPWQREASQPAAAAPADERSAFERNQGYPRPEYDGAAQEAWDYHRKTWLEALAYARVAASQPEAAAGQEAVAIVDSWVNGSYSRKYQVRWLRDVEAGTQLCAAPPAQVAPLAPSATLEGAKHA